MQRFPNSPDYQTFSAEYASRPHPVARPMPLSLPNAPPEHHSPPEGTAVPYSPGAVIPNPITPQSNQSYDLFDDIEWSWSPTPTGEHSAHMTFQFPQSDPSFLHSPSPPQGNSPPVYPPSESSYTPLSAPSSLPFPLTPSSSIPSTDGLGQDIPHSKPPHLSSSLPTNVPDFRPINRFTSHSRSGSSGGEHSPLRSDWHSDTSPRPGRRRPIRRSETDVFYSPAHHNIPQTSPPSNRTTFSPVNRTPGAQMVTLSMSPCTSSPPLPSSPVFNQVRYSGTCAPGAATSSPEPVPDNESDESQKKKRKRDSRENTPKKSVLCPPKAAPSTWQIYFTDHLHLYRFRYPDQKLNVAQAAKELAQQYKSLSAEEREPYKRRAQAAKAERDRQMLAWERTLTPQDVRAENQFRTAQRKDGKSRKANMKDPNAPKKPLSAYFMFLQRIRSSPELIKDVFGDESGTTKQSVLAAAKWRSMSDEDKKPFLARAEQEKLKYEAARREYEETFSDAFEAVPDYSSGHFIGIEQLSLEDPFVISSAVPASPKISPSHVQTVPSSSKNLKASHRDSLTEEDFRDAFEETSKERMQY